MPSFSDVYKWVDENGKTHYSSEPVASKEKVELPSINLSVSRPTMVKTSTPVVFEEAASHKDIYIDDITLNMKGSNPYVVNIGRQICKQKKPITWKNGELSSKKQSTYTRAIELVFSNYNYNIKRRFKKSGDRSLKLKIEIKNLHVNHCRYREAYQEYASKRLSQASSFIAIKWSIYNQTENKTIFEGVTEGSYDGLSNPAAPNGLEFSISEAMKSAAINLLADKKFVDAIHQLKTEDLYSLLLNSYKGNEEEIAINFSPVKKIGPVLNSIPDVDKYTAVISQSDTVFKGVHLNEAGYIFSPYVFNLQDGPILIQVDNKTVNAHVIRSDDRLGVSLLKTDSQVYAATNINLKPLGSVADTLLFIVMRDSEGIPYLNEFYTKESSGLYKSSTLSFNSEYVGQPVFNIDGEFVAVISNAGQANANEHDILPIVPTFEVMNIKPNLSSFFIDINQEGLSVLQKGRIVMNRVFEWLDKPIMTLE